MFVVKPQITLPAIDSWNLTIQRQLSNTSSLEIAYIGTIGTHVFAGGSDYDPNQPRIDGFGFTSTNARKPFFQRYGWSQNLRYFGSDATSRYHALQVKFEKRLSSGLNVMSHFTYSKNIDYTNVYYNQDAALARGISQNSRPKAFVFTANYNLPFGKGQKFGNNLAKPLDLMLGGWQMNGVMNWFSGLGFTPTYQNCGADQDVGVCRPDAVGNVFASDPTQYGWFNTASAVLASNGATSGPWQRPQRGKLGTVGRNRLIGPAFQQIDFSLFKTFSLTEKYRVQFRAESFNLANRTNLAAPNTCVDCPGVAGRIFNTYVTYVPRTVQFALRLDF